MIIGIGIDVVQISRVGEKLARRVLSAEEQAIWEKNRNQSFLAGRFALKEAFLKALGTGIRSVKLTELSFIPNELGAIHLLRNETVAYLENVYKFDRVHSTLSHDGGIAIAVVILEKEGGVEDG